MESNEALEHRRIMEIIKTIGWMTLAAVAVVSLAAYGCERLDSAANANKPPCKAYTCVDK